jgi:hypothetical protein
MPKWMNQQHVNADGEYHLLTTISVLNRQTVLPNLIAKKVHQLNPLAIGYMTLIWNGTRFYIGEVLDVYKKGASSRYGSVPGATSISGLAYLSLRVYLPLTTVCMISQV